MFFFFILKQEIIEPSVNPPAKLDSLDIDEESDERKIINKRKKTAAIRLSRWMQSKYNLETNSYDDPIIANSTDVRSIDVDMKDNDATDYGAKIKAEAFYKVNIIYLFFIKYLQYF